MCPVHHNPFGRRDPGPVDCRRGLDPQGLVDDGLQESESVQVNHGELARQGGAVRRCDLVVEPAAEVGVASEIEEGVAQGARDCVSGGRWDESGTRIKT